MSNLENFADQPASQNNFPYRERTFDDYTQEELENYKKANGLLALKKLPDGFWCSVKPLMYTVSICAGAEPLLLFRYRWCFEDAKEAVLFWKQIQNYDDIPESRDSLVGHRYLNYPKYLEFDKLDLPKW